MEMGALSLVMDTWWGTSRTCSRKSTCTARSKKGMSMMKPGPRSPKAAPEAEKHQPLVFIDDADGIRQQDDKNNENHNKQENQRTADHFFPPFGKMNDYAFLSSSTITVKPSLRTTLTCLPAGITLVERALHSSPPTCTDPESWMEVLAVPTMPTTFSRL